jgi:hypothetical protein
VVQQVATLAIGDVLLYQSRGGAIRDFIRCKILEAEPPVTVVAHSLGGVACVDLLAGSERLHVEHLITVGSQSSLLYEMGLLTALPFGMALPNHFPPWLNVYDRNDFLSFFAAPLLGDVRDWEVWSGEPFPDSHSAYFGNEKVWQAIRQFVLSRSNARRAS